MVTYLQLQTVPELNPKIFPTKTRPNIQLMCPTELNHKTQLLFSLQSATLAHMAVTHLPISKLIIHYNEDLARSIRYSRRWTFEIQHKQSRSVLISGAKQ